MQRKLSNMRKLIFLFLAAPFFSTAQNKLMVQGVSPGLYLVHKVAPKENYYSVGRIYNVSPKEIAPFNNLQLEKGLSLGQTIKIPLNSMSFFQSGTAESDETFVPVYHKIKEKEGLLRVAKNYNDLPLETLRQWNNITSDGVKNGVQLVVGYLKVKTELSSLAKNGIGTTIGSAVTVATEDKRAVTPEVAKTPPVKKTVEKTKTKGTEKEKAINDAETKTLVEGEKVNAKLEKKRADAEPKKAPPEKNTVETNFKNLYEAQVKNAEIIEMTGDAGVFKSTSGWTDKKYYCLYSSASPGTVMKVTNPANGNFVYVKVLDNVPDIKKNEGLLLVISNAAADALGAVESNLSCSISYAK